MKLVKVAAAIVNQIPLAWNHNRRNIIKLIHQARQEGVDLIAFPELSVCGYNCEDAFLSPNTLAQSLDSLQIICQESQGIIACVGLPLLYQSHLFNVACLMADCQILGFVAKRHLANNGIHYEARWFHPWTQTDAVKIELTDQSTSLGSQIFDISGIRIGFEICEDAWVAQRPGLELSQEAVDIILNPSASHFAFGKQQIRRQLLLEGSRIFGASLVYANLSGCEAGRAIYDGGSMIANQGRIVASLPRFSFQDADYCSAIIDIDQSRMLQAGFTNIPQKREQKLAWSVSKGYNWKKHSLSESVRNPDLPTWESGPYIKEEEFTRSVSLGLFDYLRKTRSQGFVVSLSGGADSSAVSSLVYIMLQLSKQEIGLAGLYQSQSHLDGCQSWRPEAWMSHLLSCAYQSTRNSGHATRQAARVLAEGLSASFYEWDVEEAVAVYQQRITEALGRSLNWQLDDIALQNVQARSRVPAIWMLANIKNALLLNTSNRSEAAVGYATMDGDTNGGLSPIGGIDKAFLRHWLRWLEQIGPEQLGGIASLNLVNQNEPTAELRPASQNQKDETDLMPYDVLDFIEKMAIRDKKSPSDAFAYLKSRYDGFYSDQQLLNFIEKFFRLWCQNQWKRERYAPSFHLDDENLDPKTWCRFPIFSGGFLAELDNLRQQLGMENQKGIQ